MNAGTIQDSMVWNTPPDGMPVTTTPLASSFSASCAVDAGGDKGRLSARQLVLQLALNGILTDGDLCDATLVTSCSNSL